MANPTKPFPRPTELTVASLSRPLEARALPRRHGEHEDDIPGSGERFFSTQDTCFSLGKPFPAAAHAHGEVSPNGSGGGAAVSDRAACVGPSVLSAPSETQLYSEGAGASVEDARAAQKHH